MLNFRRFDDFLLETLRAPADAALYLRIALEEYENDSDSVSFLHALDNVIKSQGGIDSLAARSKLSPPSQTAFSLDSKIPFELVNFVGRALRMRLVLLAETEASDVPGPVSAQA